MEVFLLVTLITTCTVKGSILFLISLTMPYILDIVRETQLYTSMYTSIELLYVISGFQINFLVPVY